MVQYFQPHAVQHAKRHPFGNVRASDAGGCSPHRPGFSQIELLKCGLHRSKSAGYIAARVRVTSQQECGLHRSKSAGYIAALETIPRCEGGLAKGWIDE